MLLYAILFKILRVYLFVDIAFCLIYNKLNETQSDVFMCTKGRIHMKIISSVPSENIFLGKSDIKNANISPEVEGNIINIYDDILYQEMLGFGGAFTESSAYNYSLMDEKSKKEFIKAYFDKTEGLGYNFGRTHINSCDFSLGSYTNVTEGDKTLESFNIERDKKYIIPFLKDVIEFTGEDLILFASPWSPPAYMKDNKCMLGGGKLLEEYKEIWALYYAKYIKAYLNEGIKISAVSIQNEPKAIQSWESCYYTPEDERDFIEKYLIPVFEKEGLSHIKIIIWDHNKERVYDRAKTILENEKVAEKVWAVGHHWYSGDHFEALTLVETELKKPNICTEFCASMKMVSSLEELAEKYAREICRNINNYCVGICDWNLFLDENGGPYHHRMKEGTDAIKLDYNIASAGCYSPVMLNNKKGTFERNCVYYYIAHFSKYIKRGAKRIATTKYTDALDACAFLNPNGETVAVIMNTADVCQKAVIRHRGECTEITLEPHSIVTALF